MSAQGLKIDGNINKCDVLVLYTEKCQHETLYSSLNQYFPDDRCFVLPNHACAKN